VPLVNRTWVQVDSVVMNVPYLTVTVNVGRGPNGQTDKHLLVFFFSLAKIYIIMYERTAGKIVSAFPVDSCKMPDC
jgi:hypothetical protein